MYKQIIFYRLSIYLGDSRNLHRQVDKHRKYKLLHQGKEDIITFLQRLPKTTHDVAAFVIDMPVAVVSTKIKIHSFIFMACQTKSMRQYY